LIVQDESRRSALKKGAAFIIPAVATFKLGELKVGASQGNPTGGIQSNGNPPGGNHGNHYGNDMPDMNDHDSSKWDTGLGENTGPHNPPS